MRKKLPSWVAALTLAVAAAGLWAQHGAPEAATSVPPQETGRAHSGKSAGEGGHGGLEIWKWANFALLAGALGYLVRKNAGPYFAARSQKIRQDMRDAEELRQQAQARAAAVDRRLANLEAEIAALRQEAAREGEAEHTRMGLQIAAEIAKIEDRAVQEIASAGKTARMELKRYSAALALGLAEQKIRTRLTPAVQDALVRGFVRELPGARPVAGGGNRP